MYSSETVQRRALGVVSATEQKQLLEEQLRPAASFQRPSRQCGETVERVPHTFPAASAPLFKESNHENQRIIEAVSFTRGYGVKSSGEVSQETLYRLVVSLFWIVLGDEDNHEQKKNVDIVTAVIAAQVQNARIHRTELGL